MALKRLRFELNSEWATESGLVPEGFMAIPQGLDGDDIFQWKVVIPGPEGSPYESGHFVLSYKFPRDYPFKPPIVCFLTPIHHSYVYQPGGHISIEILRDQWSPALSALKVAQTVQAILAESQAEGLALRSINPEEHHRLVRLSVREHAQDVEKSITDGWVKMFGPPLVLTLHLSGWYGAVDILTCTNMSGTQVASLTIDAHMKVKEARVLISEQLDIPDRRLKLCLPDGTLLESLTVPKKQRTSSPCDHRLLLELLDIRMDIPEDITRAADPRSSGEMRVRIAEAAPNGQPVVVEVEQPGDSYSLAARQRRWTFFNWPYSFSCGVTSFRTAKKTWAASG